MITSYAVLYLEYFRSYFLLLLFFKETFKNKNNLRTVEAEISQEIENNEARSKFTGSYRKESVKNET